MFSKLQRFSVMIKNAIIKHPIEILFVTYVTVILMPNVGHYDLFNAFHNLIALAPICFIVLYLARNTKAYWFLIPLPVVTALFYSDIKLELLEDSRYWAVVLCTFLCLISQHWHKNNYNFVSQMTNKLVNITFAFVLATIIFGALSCITFAITELFNLNKYDYTIFKQFWVFSILWAFPVLFLTLENQHSANDSSYLNRVGEMLLNWILSPALIIYTAIIYAYVVFIALQGQMPNGVVANVAFPYLTIGLAIQAVQLLLQNAKWQWFYRYFAYLALLPLALIWYAIYIRLNHYGLTEARIYLVIGAITLSICYGLLISKRLAQYRFFSAISIVVILFSVFILDPHKIALEDQTQRLDSYLVKHKLLDVNNKIDTQAVLEHKKVLGENRDEIEHLDSMIRYIAKEYTAEQFKQKYGIESGYDLIYKTGERNYDTTTFEASNSELIRLTKDDMKNAQEYIIFNLRYYRPNRLNNHAAADNKQCKKLISQAYDFRTSDRQAKYEYINQECNKIQETPTEFIIEFSGIEPNIKFNINDVVKKVFDKHNLSMNERHKTEILDKVKADLLKLDLGNAELSLNYIELKFLENTGYVVESISTNYLMLK
ncbi:hypothetical protein MHD_08370 [Mannheimia granulomatis]|uniref:DUF4153 domain-containing protein n=1 Tax=Mannheimia granulomatis TaxID=85402 RepID=A0A011ND16_9PAST|nr:DUF4153 domain-containing protein [Mannheimia granulomatis]EXI62335.1 hypothetical protein AK33_06370 [Mannheimia granulomatis]RGE47696.1 hypothetical protein MHD_08370 [Mannheimia granulomatis]